MTNHNIYDVFRGRFPSDRTNAFLETAKDDIFSYSDLERESALYARALTEQGIRPGDRVAVQVDKSAQALFLYIGCLRAGFIYLPLNTAYTSDELDYFLGDAQPAAVVCRPESESALRRLADLRGVERVYTLDAAGGGSLVDVAGRYPADFEVHPSAPEDIAVILYTSGTTGRPKGAMISHGNLAANGQALTESWGFTSEDVLLHALPIFHIHGLFVACHCALLSGSRMIFLPRFDPEAVIRNLPRATVFMGVPTYYTRLLAQPGFTRDSCRTMRLFTCGSAPLLVATFESFRERTGHLILERYGMTETGMNTSNPLDGERRPGTVGFPLPGVRVRIVGDGGCAVPSGEVGGLEVAGSNVFRGYWRLPEKTAEDFTDDGYFKTGDLAKMDSAGYVSIVGRSKDMVISGGFNVYPKEIERLIDDMDGVVESAVIGVPHPDFGEGVTAVVVRSPASPAPDAETVVRELKERLANYKVPKRVIFVDQLPRNTMGKVQKNVLRERYADCYSGGEPGRGRG